MNPGYRLGRSEKTVEQSKSGTKLKAELLEQIIIQRSIPNQARREVVKTFKKLDDWLGFKYVVVA